MSNTDQREGRMEKLERLLGCFVRAPALWGQGNWVVVIVPEEAVREATEALSTSLSGRGD
jgi:hypothetical protein